MSQEYFLHCKDGGISIANGKPVCDKESWQKAR